MQISVGLLKMGKEPRVDTRKALSGMQTFGDRPPG